jgi:hypothetical protein
MFFDSGEKFVGHQPQSRCVKLRSVERQIVNRDGNFLLLRRKDFSAL